MLYAWKKKYFSLRVTFYKALTLGKSTLLIYSDIVTLIYVQYCTYISEKYLIS